MRSTTLKHPPANIRELMRQGKAYDTQRKAMPSQDPFDEGYKRLPYCRDGDDFVIGVIGAKEDAKTVYGKVKAFVETELLLPRAAHKSGIHHAREGIESLGYRVRVETTDKAMKGSSHGRYTMAQTVSGRVR
jgi:hypothetical protein